MRLQTVMLVSLVLLAGACDDGGPSESVDEDTSPPEELVLTTTPDGYVEPSDEALAGARELGLAPDGVLDCGRVAADSGFPTTIQSLDEGLCFVEAVQGGAAASVTFTGRDDKSGSLVTQFVSDGSGVVREHRFVVSAAGEVSESTATCTPADAGSQPPVTPTDSLCD